MTLFLEQLMLWTPKARSIVAIAMEESAPAAGAVVEFFGRHADDAVGGIQIYRLQRV